MGAGVWLSVPPWARPWIPFPAQRQSKAKSNKRCEQKAYQDYLWEIGIFSLSIRNNIYFFPIAQLTS